MTTLAQRYNAKCFDLMPIFANYDDLWVDHDIDDANHIDEIVFRRSEYQGGMAAVILSILAQEDAA